MGYKERSECSSPTLAIIISWLAGVVTGGTAASWLLQASFLSLFLSPPLTFPLIFLLLLLLWREMGEGREEKGEERERHPVCPISNLVVSRSHTVIAERS